MKEEVTYGSLVEEVCNGVPFDSMKLSRASVTRAFKEYLRRSCGMRARVRGDRYGSVLKIVKVPRCKCTVYENCPHERELYSEREWNLLASVLGRYCIKPTWPRNTYVYVDPMETSIPHGYEDEIVAPVLVAPKHQDLVRKLARQMINEVRPLTFIDEDPMPPAEPPRFSRGGATRWLEANRVDLCACFKTLGRQGFLKWIDDAGKCP